MSSSRRIDFEISEANGARSIGGQIELAKRSLDERIATILCIDDSGNEAIVLRDEHGGVRVYETRRGGEVDPYASAGAIDAGVCPWIVLAGGTGDRVASLLLDSDEMCEIDDGQEWWIDTDEVDLILRDNGTVTLSVTRRTPLPDPDRRDGDEWVWDETYAGDVRYYELGAWTDVLRLSRRVLLRILLNREDFIDGYDRCVHRVIGGAA
jgi:hypothetical protein